MPLSAEEERAITDLKKGHALSIDIQEELAKRASAGDFVGAYELVKAYLNK